jgi:hypothetical protein
MRFSSVLISALATATTARSSPAASTPRSNDVAGHVFTNKGVTYQMTDLDEIKTFDNKVDNGEYPRPVQYKLEAGFHCIFYR